MTLLRAAGPAGGVELAAEARARLRTRLGAALRRARARGRATLAAATFPFDPAADPSAIVCASRRPGEPWACFEHPDAGGAAIATLGCVRELAAAGPERFRAVAQAWRGLVAGACADEGDGPRGSGLIALGGFSFAPEGARGPHWGGFPPASLIVPELALARRDGEVRLTLAALVAPDDTVEDLLAALDRRLAGLRFAPLPLLDPSPTGRVRVASVAAPEHYESAVRRATERIAAGELEKVVLAREIEVHAPAPHDPAAVLGVLRDSFPACYCFCVGRGARTFLAASPELLIRREGLRASTLGLAGSMRRSADPAVDDHLAERLLHSESYREEHAIVVRRITRALRPHAVWVTSAPEPRVVKIANIQHLATPIRAQLHGPIGVVELAGLLHPTPAVGGEPHAVAARLIPELEGMDRGWYAGPVGWTDASEDGELCVALRCALLEGPLARCYAGNGIVRDSDPASELAETEVKLAALLPVLSL